MVHKICLCGTIHGLHILLERRCSSPRRSRRSFSLLLLLLLLLLFVPSRVYSPSPSSLYSSSSTPKTLAPATRNPSPRPFATVSMVSPSTELKNPDQRDGALQELLTEFMVDMKCEGCVSSVKSNLQKLDGIKNVDVDLSNQVVRVLGSLPVKTMLDALEQTGRSARLIGQGNPNDFLISAAVAEFKGPVIFGVVRLAQVTMELARIEASFSGLSPGKHGWSINEFGDLTRGAASTGKYLIGQIMHLRR
uniref:HMA domain-containing protein n=1 Tax=Ananas comosus var. bracteatus TaxID=296719 RepID=A0A6V7PWW2_ANACO|nr:unnamed protein product [Ananas comosus var. bracteatus]